MRTRKRILATLTGFFMAACAISTHAAPDIDGSAPTNPNPGAKIAAPLIYASTPEHTAAALRAISANPQPAILAATSASEEMVVFPDASRLPVPVQKLVPDLPVGAKPHGVGYFGRDNALVSDFGNSRIFVVKVSTAQLLDTIDTSSPGYGGTGSIAIAPNLTAALAMGSSSTLFVLQGPFSAASSVKTLTLPGAIAGYQTEAIVFNNAGRAFVYNSAGISVLDAPYSSVAFTIPVSNDASGSIAISPDGNTLLTTTLSGNQVNIFKAPFGANSTSTTLSIPSGSGLDGIAITPDGTKAIVVSAFSYQVAAISAPFSANSVVENLPLPAGSAGGFEDVGISADSNVAILTGNNGGPPVFISAPFTAAGAQVFAVPLQTGGDTSRGNGAVRFLPPGLAPGLTISKSAAATVGSGGNLTYTLTFQNTGTSNAAGVVIRDPLPQGTNFVSATGGGTLNSGNVVFNVGAVTAGAGARTVSFTVNVTAGTGSNINNNNYTIAGNGIAPIPGPPVVTRVGGSQANPPTITSFTPPCNRPGTRVVITGTNFTGATRVTFNGRAATFTVNSPTRITATVPVGATSGRITVTTPSGTATSALNFLVTPTITVISPDFGPAGTRVTVRGLNFENTSRVTLGGKLVSFTLVNSSTITFYVPGRTGGVVTVTTPCWHSHKCRAVCQ